MSKPGFAMLQDVIMDPDFPDLDLALRRGRHVDRDDAAWYALLSDAQEQLEEFYRRYGCELIHKTDGYFYLLPTGDKISRKQLAPTDMLVGQALALLYLDPANVERGGVIAHEDLVAQLSSVLGTDALIAAFNPGTGTGKRKKYDERIAQRNVRSRVAEAVRRLAAMGFVDVTEDERVRLRPALLRFAEPVRGLSEPAEALAKLVARGEVALAPEEESGGESPLAAAEDEEPQSAAETLTGVPAPDLGHDADGGVARVEGAVRSVPGADRSVAGGAAASTALAAQGGIAVTATDEPVSGVTSRLAPEPPASTEDEPAAARAADAPAESAPSANPAPQGTLDAALGEPAASPEAPPRATADATAPESATSAEAVLRATEDDASAESAWSSEAAYRETTDAASGELASSSGLEADAQPQPLAADVHPMDRDLDWADILPDVPEPEPEPEPEPKPEGRG